MRTVQLKIPEIKNGTEIPGKKFSRIWDIVREVVLFSVENSVTFISENV